MLTRTAAAAVAAASRSPSCHRFAPSLDFSNPILTARPAGGPARQRHQGPCLDVPWLLLARPRQLPLIGDQNCC